MSPTVNVNLRPCDCPPSDTPGQRHETACASLPVLIPSTPRRSATFTVALGECMDSHRLQHNPRLNPACGAEHHAQTCPARPVRVSCSISGKTWAESEVTEADWQTRNERGDWRPSPMSYAERGTALAACRDRLALLKALVLGQPQEDEDGRWKDVGSLFTQRDAVYAALADMARHEEGLGAAAQRAADAMGAEGSMTGAVRASHEFLAAYVEHLVEQVGQL